MKKKDLTKFLDKLDFLFPITSCTHKVIPCIEETSCGGCEIGAHLLNCSCQKEKQIPRLELKFVMAMQEHRPPGHKASMMIGGPDKVESARQEKAVKRKKLVADRSLRKTQREKEHEVELEKRVEEHKELYEDGGEVEDEKVEDEEGYCDSGRRTELASNMG